MSTELANRAEALATLRKPFPAENIAKLPKVNCRNCTQAKGACNNHRMARCGECNAWITTGHIHLDYVGHAEATDRLLDADPEWTWEPMALTPDGLPMFDSENGMWIRLTVAGVTRLGYGSADGKRGPNAIKEVIGDAIRNAGMRFGMALDLWAKTDLHADEREDSEAEHVAAQQDRDTEAPQDRPDRPAKRHPGRVDDEWNTASGQQLPSPAPGMPSATDEQIGEMVRLLGVKRGVFNGQCARVVSELVRRRIDDPRGLSQAEARSVIEALTAEPDQTAAAPEPEAAPAGPAPVGTPSNPGITAPQQKAMHALLNKAGYGDRAKGLELLARYVGRPLESSKDLSKAEANTVITKLSNGELPPPAPVPADDGPAPSDEGISEFDALDQMIRDVDSDEAVAEVEKAIADELLRRGITQSDAELLLERLSAHVRNAKAAA